MLVQKTISKDIIHYVFPNLNINQHNLYFEISLSGKIIGLFEIQILTQITGILHLHILEEFQNQGLAIHAVKELIKALKNTEIKQLIGTIPETNQHIMSIVNKTPSKCCGLIKDGIIWNNQLQNLILFQLDLNEVS